VTLQLRNVDRNADNKQQTITDVDEQNLASLHMERTFTREINRMGVIERVSKRKGASRVKVKGKIERGDRKVALSN